MPGALRGCGVCFLVTVVATFAIGLYFPSLVSHSFSKPMPMGKSASTSNPGNISHQNNGSGSSPLTRHPTNSVLTPRPSTLRVFSEEFDGTANSSDLLRQLMEAADSLNGKQYDLIASSSGPVCRWRREGYLLVLESFREGLECNIVSPPFLYDPSRVTPPRVHRSPGYPQLGMSMQTLEWFLRLNSSVRIATTPTAVVPALRPKDSLCGFLSFHWAAEEHGFRAIREPDGAMVWPTCARNLQSCRQTDPSAPPHDGGPVCCAHVLKTMLFDLNTSLQRHRKALHIIAGTLLASARQGKMIPWDNDCDVAVADQSWPWVQWLSDVAPGKYLTTMAMHMCKACPHFARIFPKHPYRTPAVAAPPDLHTRLRFLHLYKNFYWKGGYIDVVFERFSQCVPTLLEGNTFCASGPVELYLEKTYGRSWRTPDKNFSDPLPFGDPNLVPNSLIDWPPLIFKEQKQSDPKRRHHYNSLPYLQQKCGRP
jgi:hypothetical protein